MNEMLDFFLEAYSGIPTLDILLEAVAFFFGIASVVFAKKENILVYPTGLVATIITVYLMFKAEYFGDMTMNFYYSVMSLYGWWNWSRKMENNYVVPISKTTLKEKLIGLVMFTLTVMLTYFVYFHFKEQIKIVNYVDVFTSGIFFTAMWYMANKKIENWLLWIFANIITIPLYAYKGLGMLSLQYFIFTILAIQGHKSWKKILHRNLTTS